LGATSNGGTVYDKRERSAVWRQLRELGDNGGGNRHIAGIWGTATFWKTAW
jgi:hypothetical protein